MGNFVLSVIEVRRHALSLQQCLADDEPRRRLSKVRAALLSKTLRQEVCDIELAARTRGPREQVVDLLLRKLAPERGQHGAQLVGVDLPTLRRFGPPDRLESLLQSSLGVGKLFLSLRQALERVEGELTRGRDLRKDVLGLLVRGLLGAQAATDPG